MPTLKKILRFAFSIKGFTVLFVLETIRLEIIGEGYSAPGIVVSYLFFISPWLAWIFYGRPKVEAWMEKNEATLPVGMRASRLRKKHREILAAIEDSDLDDEGKRDARAAATKELREQLQEIMKA